jgi:ABC-type lipoprotein release transport system permease subunit
LIAKINKKRRIDMKKNMGTTDKAIRTLFAVAVAVLYILGMISGTVAIILGTLAVIFILTSLVSFCPLYAPFGISTCKKEQVSG